ncbi:HNH endonuclease [Candidatus Saccharibacteria bacterium]|nr:HNH endonuclease [Candidatus Saccharibacteria bacterium]
MKQRRIIAAALAVAAVILWLVINPESYEKTYERVEETAVAEATSGGDAGNAGAFSDIDASTSIDENGVELARAADLLESLEVKGRAPKTGYARTEFYNGWPDVDGCNLRQRILRRDFGETAVLSGCMVMTGEFDEPYTGQHLVFTAKEQISTGVQIDHVVALSDAWQKGAQYQTPEQRYAIATDPMNLLAVESKANQQKSDGDAATWLPSNKAFRCQYVARQVAVKYKYSLWVTTAEKQAISDILEACPNEKTWKIKY